MTFVARPAADPGHDPVPGPAGVTPAIWAFLQVLKSLSYIQSETDRRSPMSPHHQQKPGFCADLQAVHLLPFTRRQTPDFSASL